MSGPLRSLLALKRQAQAFGAPSVRSFAAETLPQFKSSVVRDPATGLLAPQWHFGSFNVEPGNSKPRPGMHFGTRKAAQERDIGAPFEYLDRELTREVVDEFGWEWKDPRTGDEVKRRMDAIMDSDPAAALEGYRPEPGSVKTAPYLLDIRKPLIVEDAGGDNDKWDYLLRRAREMDHDGLLYKNKVEDKGSNSWVTLGDRPQVKSLRARTLDMSNFDANYGKGGIVKSARALFKNAATGTVPEYKSRSKLIDMSVDDFTDLATYLRPDQYNQAKLDNIRNVIKSGKPLETNPFLVVDKGGQVTMHEGRHRAKVLKELGYTHMPVEIRSRDIRWSEQGDPEKFDYVPDNEWPAELRGQPPLEDSRAFPVSREGAMDPYAGGGLVRGLKSLRKGLAAADPEALTPSARLRDADEQLRRLPEVIKKPGGNWLTGSVERAVAPLKVAPNVIADNRNLIANPPTWRSDEAQQTLIRETDAQEALNRWIDKKLTPYIKNDMATERDPIRALAERGVTHAEPRRMSFERVDQHRSNAPWSGADGYGESPEAIAWEDAADLWVRPELLGDVRAEVDDLSLVSPLEKLPDDSIVHSLGNWSSDLGFDHIIDVLREQLTTGALTPQQLDKVNIANAVERTHAYNLEREAAKKAALAANLESMTPYKAYDDGWRWVQLDKPGQFAAESDAMGHSVRGYEPPRGHKDWTKESGNSGSLGYGLGGWDAITSGRAKIYSLKDSKGKTYATVEASENPWWEEKGFESNVLNDQDLREAYSDIWREIDPTEENLRNFPQLLKERFPDVYEAHGHKFPERILKVRQLKGPSNGKPDPAALPYIQDFVRSGNWAEVRDLQNARMQSLGGKHYSEDDLRGIYERAMKSLTPEQRADETIPPFEDLGWNYYPLKAEHADDITQDTPFDSAIMRELGLKP